MKSLFLGVLFTLSLVAGLNANVDKKDYQNELFKEQESCVSIAGKLAGGDSEKFAAAYNGCIYGRL